MSDSPPRLPEIIDALLTERGWRTSPSLPELRSPGKDASQLVFVGNWQDPCPRRLLFDPDLESVDIVTWQIIRVHADASQLVAFPSYEQLMRAVKVARATVARALAVLRLTRWLPLCAALRDAEGRFAGHVYALNDEPVPLTEMLTIDAAYVPFVEQALRHRNTHVRTLAQAAYQAIRDQATTQDVASHAPVRLGDQLADRVINLIRLLNDVSPRRTEARHRVQNLNSVNRVQNLNAVRSSSHLNKETTTTQSRPAEKPRHGSPNRDRSPPVVFPAELSLTESQRRVIGFRLEPVPAELRQDILDEGTGRILAKRSTPDPVRCEFDYLASLCVKALDERFVFTDAGEGVRRKRTGNATAEERLRQARAYSEAQRLKEIEAHEARQARDGAGDAPET